MFLSIIFWMKCLHVYNCNMYIRTYKASSCKFYTDGMSYSCTDAMQFVHDISVPTSYYAYVYLYTVLFISFDVSSSHESWSWKKKRFWIWSGTWQCDGFCWCRGRHRYTEVKCCNFNISPNTAMRNTYWSTCHVCVYIHSNVPWLQFAVWDHNISDHV